MRGAIPGASACAAWAAQQCGWLKDRYRLSWQIVPKELSGLVADPDAARAARVMKAKLQMKKIDLAGLRRAALGWLKT